MNVNFISYNIVVSWMIYIQNIFCLGYGECVSMFVDAICITYVEMPEQIPWKKLRDPCFY